VISDDDLDLLALPLLDDGDTLHPGQRRAVHSIAQRDTLVVLPTGSGKTLVHQLASRMLGGLTVLVTPTLSLQADQLAVVRASGARAEGLNGSLRGTRRRAVLDAARAGDLDVVVLTPEQLAVDEVLDAVAASDVRLFVIDEAHCVATWGVDFRPHYLALGGVVQRLGTPGCSVSPRRHHRARGSRWPRRSVCPTWRSSSATPTDPRSTSRPA
jgi:ATP-dependent DNA helicase RecQ